MHPDILAETARLHLSELARDATTRRAVKRERQRRPVVAGP